MIEIVVVIAVLVIGLIVMLLRIDRNAVVQGSDSHRLAVFVGQKTKELHFPTSYTTQLQ